ncbi:5-amino-6-(5-phospho-D-ribitylamino)uracil phosphatase YigB [Vibrio zhugei]|uniref:5-amino-6-(5-phospho-D-ribitylamino)uracil phosphatase YigB n=1 Tax=Vibrio zhugei TaxID=2479546 RepID=A0ABV7CE00_9VIBR|nr:5-amino-6-(5-phospho-D-ribitylamino)uracil phosphatase YigB [Vibrio zhugei]
MFYRNMPAIHAMTFDLDDTLYDNWPVIQHLDTEITRWMHEQHPVTASQSPDWWAQVKQQVVSEHPMLQHDVSQWRLQQIARGLALLGYEPEQALSDAQVAMEHVHYLRNLVTVPEETHRVLGQLAQHIPLVAITNGNVDAEKIGLMPYFSAVFRAGPDGRAKPYGDLFEKAAALLPCERQHILHVGDHPVTDVLGAKQHGFQACWFNDRFANAKDCRRLTVLPDMEIQTLAPLLTLIEESN